MDATVGHQNTRLDLLIGFVPMTLPSAPPIGPHIVKAVAERAGFTAEVMDFNLDLYERLPNKSVYLEEDKTFNYRDSDGLLYFDTFLKSALSPILEQWVDTILKKNPRIIGLSLFSDRSAFCARALGEALYLRAPQIKILLGGPFTHEILLDEKAKIFFSSFPFDIIAGEAEESLPKYLSGDYNFPGINSKPDQIKNLDIVPIPNYDGVDFSTYDSFYEKKRVFITSSRGCVRRCTFCDVRAFWPNYRNRSAQNVFQEMIYLHEHHGRERFEFTDSLTNGSLVHGRELWTQLSQWRAANPHKKLGWQGQFICRDKTTFNSSVYDLLKASGCSYLSVGIESASEHVRSHMQKKFSNDDLFFMLEQLYRVKIPITLLMMVGYLNETEEDFAENLSFFKKCKDMGYLDRDQNGFQVIDKISLGPTLIIHPLAPIHPIAEREFKIKWDENGHWFHESSSRKLRLERLFTTMSFLEGLGMGGNKPLLSARYKHFSDELRHLQTAEL